MEEKRSAQSIWKQLHEYVRNYDAEGQASLFAEDAVWEFPFAPEGIPNRIEGKEKILAVSKAGMERSQQSGRRIKKYKDVVIHTEIDPGVVIVEFTLEGETQDNTSYSIPYIQVLKTQNGKIVSLKDYFPGEILKAALHKTT